MVFVQSVKIISRLLFKNLNLKVGEYQMEHKCLLCDYVYNEEKGDPEHGIPPGTKWEDIDDDFVCPECGASKADFE